MNSREEILNKIKRAKKNSSAMIPGQENSGQKIIEGIDSVTPKDRAGLWNQFKNELEAIAGEFHSVNNVDHAADIIEKHLTGSELKRIGISREKICADAAAKIGVKLPGVKIISPEKYGYEERKKEYAATETAIVHPLYAVADIGSLVFSYERSGTSYPHFLCDTTFAIIYEEQIVANQFELFKNLNRDESRNMVFVTGPSRTADIEKVLVLGAHGPRKLVVIMISKNN